MALSGLHNSRLKQSNKKHNIIGHRSKRQIDVENKGRVSAKQITQKFKKELKREQRKQQSKQVRANKREEALAIKRQLGTADSPPFLVSVIPLSLDISIQKVLLCLTNSDSSSICNFSQQGIAHLSLGKLKQRFSFNIPPVGDLYSILDAAKGSDTILFIWKFGEELNDAFNLIISTLLSQGSPSVLHAVYEDPTEEFSTKKKLRMLKNLQMDVQGRFQGNCRLYFLNKDQEVNLLLRQIGSQKLKNVFYKDKRAHIVAENLNFDGEGSIGCLKIEGYIRSQPLSVNRLIHIPGWGEFQIGEVGELPDPFPLDPKRRPQDREFNVYFPDPELQECLDSTYDIDPAEEEEAWQEEEGTVYDNESVSEFHVGKLRGPKGSSSYQAAWTLDDDEKGDGESDDDDDSQTMNEDSCPVFPLTDAPNTDDEESGDEIADESDNDDDRTTLTDIDNDYDANVDYGEEIDFLTKIRAAREDAEFPDEMDTPMDIPARLRFQKYRGLESFHTSSWDKEEKCPKDYNRIATFKNFAHSRKRFLKDREGLEPGAYACLTLKDVPKHLYLNHLESKSPLVAFSMFPLEQKMSVVHVVVKSNSCGHRHPIKSKERLIFHIGFRRFSNCPIFNEHTSGDKHKFLRYFQPGDTVVASMYAPVTFPPCPVLVFKEKPNGAQDLVALGSVICPDPNRLIIKKIVLSGHPFKVAPRFSVIRYMFFNREDILWYKSIMIRTKLGRKGHIAEPVGTHGHMKCIFDKQLQSHDTILMNLYKRTYPKWRFDPAVPRPRPFFAKSGPISLLRYMEQKEKEKETQVEYISKKKKVKFMEGL